MKYKIQIGSILVLPQGKLEPKQTIIISEEQFEVIKQFASVEKDENLNDIYKLNECVFTIVPHFEIEEKKELKKPPIGLIPKRFHTSKRIVEITNAMIRYAEAEKEIPSEWFQEYNDLCASL